MEVTSLDAVHQAAEAWLRAQGGDAAVSRLSPIADTHWKSRIFTVEPEPGFRFSFWAWTDPLKGKPVALEGDLSAAGMRFAIVVARWNAVDHRSPARRRARRAPAQRRRSAAISRSSAFPAHGRFPPPRATIANTGRVDAIVTLGCLLRGETAHYEAIYNEVARGIGQSQQETGIPHSFGVLTCETLEQALESRRHQGRQQGL